MGNENVSTSVERTEHYVVAYDGARAGHTYTTDVVLQARDFCRSMSLWGLKGKVPRSAFGLLSVAVVTVSVAIGSGYPEFLSYALYATAFIGAAVAQSALYSVSLVCLVWLYREVTGPRYPLHALLALAASALFCGVAAWDVCDVPALFPSPVHGYWCVIFAVVIGLLVFGRFFYPGNSDSPLSANNFWKHCLNRRRF